MLIKDKHLTAHHNNNKKGFLLVLVVVLSSALFLGSGALVLLSITKQREMRTMQDSMQAFYLAETGLVEAVWYLENVSYDATGLSGEHVWPSVGSFNYVIAGDGVNFSVTSDGYVPSQGSYRVMKSQEYAGTVAP